MTSTTATATVAALHGVTVRFGDRAVLDDASLSIDRAGTYVLEGPSGTGKSTLLNVLAGYVEPTSGRVEHAVRTGYVLQEPTMFSSLLVREDLAVRLVALDVPADEVADRCVAAADRIGVAHLLDHTVAQLSGGERQRVQLAGVLATAAELLLLDEPTSNLDPATRDDVLATVADVFADRAVVVVTHDPTTRRQLPDAIALRLEAGRIHRA